MKTQGSITIQSVSVSSSMTITVGSPASSFVLPAGAAVGAVVSPATTAATTAFAHAINIGNGTWTIMYDIAEPDEMQPLFDLADETKNAKT